MASNPFELLEPLAVGGMGEVWRGQHTRSGRAVAIKVLTSAEARRSEALDSFRAEVRAAASLDHPQIALVLDYGLLPTAWEDQFQGRLQGRLVAGSPYMVVEEARGGDLRGWIRQPPSWPTLRTALLQLLDALAFAHAHGVIHRDLKPGNVLLGTRREARHGLLLTDFGIAHRLADLPQPGFLPRAGTTSYMAPEQIAGDWRAYGPWTDLYALGVLTWAIVQGDAPSSGDAPLDWQPPRMAAPPGLERWLARLMREDPAERFPSAASAAAGLRALTGDAEHERISQIVAGLDDLLDLPSLAMASFAAPTANHTADPTQSDMLWTGMTLAEQPRVAPLRIGVEPAPVPAPSAPADWRPVSPPPPPIDLVDAGLGLYGLRQRPVVGREGERDALWASLHESLKADAPRVALLSGPLGSGKSRLLRWLGVRADELGVALVGRARLGQDADSGLLSVLRHALRAGGLGPEALEEHLTRIHGALFSAEERQGLVNLLCDGGGGASGRVPGERHAALIRALRRLAGPRMIVIAIDDAADDPDGVDLARHLLSGTTTGPILLVLAARDEALAAAPEITRSWAALAERPEVLSLALKPLPEGDWPLLASAGLALSPALRERVAARSAGNPLFAELLVSDWVRRGQLVVGADGFTLAPGAEVSLPESVAALVAGQLAELDASRGSADIEALMIAATLGLEVDLAEWRHATAAAGVTPAPDLVDDAMGRRLLRPTASETGFAFSQNMLREALLARAAELGRTPAHNRAAATALAEIPGGGAQRRGRLGRHLLAAGQPAAAAEPLLDASRAAMNSGRYAELRALLDLLDQAVLALPNPAAELIHAQGLAFRGHVHHFGLGDREQARAFYAAAVEAAERAGQPAVLLDTRRRLGGVTFGLGEQRAAVAILRETLSEARRWGDLKAELITATDLATVLHHGGAREEAAALGLDAVTRAVEAGMERQVATNLGTNWYLESLPGPEARVEALERAAVLLRRFDMPQHLGTTLNQLGVLTLERGDKDGAERLYLESVRVMDEIGSSYASMPRYNLAVLYTSLDRPWDAWPLLQRCLSEVLTHRWVWLEPHVRSGLARFEANGGDLLAFDAHIARIEELWRGGGNASVECTLNVEAASRAALSAGERDRARTAGELARSLFQACGEPEAAARVQDYLITNNLISNHS